MKTKFIFLTATLFYTLFGFSQTQTSIEKTMDTVFKDWNDPEKPGMAAGVIKDGEIIYLKGFGSANMETGRPITPQTLFQLGEMSKQFTTLAILLLEEQGKISQNDDIRKYLPEMPKYMHTITIGHLLNHSSGLYDINRVSNIITGSMNISTQAEALKLIASQKTLAFNPGTYFSFHESHTESVLMAEIVAKSSDQSFADFVKTNIFEPLGMKNSLIREDNNAILSNVAEPYQKDDESEEFKKNGVSSNVLGAINAYTSAEDLAKWYSNYTHPQGNLGRLIPKLDTPVQLPDGKKFSYYWGEMAIGREFTHPERGLPLFWNFGFQGAYGANVFRYVNQNIISFVLGNSNEYNGALAQNALNPFVKDLYPLPVNIDFKAKKIKKLSAEKLKNFVGDYWFKEGYASQLFVENDTLRSKWLFSRSSQTLVPLSDDTFQQYGEMEDTRLFKFKKEGDDMTILFTYNESRPDILKRYEPVEPSAKVLKSYSGAYYNKEYASLFYFRIDDGQLVASNLNHQDITLRPVKKDVFTSTSMFFNALEFLQDSSKRIKGFRIVTDGVHNLVFEKVLATANYN